MCQRCSFQIRIKPLERSPEPQRGWLSDLSWVLWMLCQRWTWPCNTVRPPRPTLLERRDGETYVSSVSASSPKTYIDTFHVISVRLWRPCWTEGHGKRSSFNPWCLSSQYHYQQLQLAKESPSLLRIFNISTLESSTFDIVWMFNLKVGGECLWPPISSKWCRAPWTFGCWPQGFLTDKLGRSFMELLIFGRSLALKSPRLGSRRNQPGTLVLGAPWGDDMETPFSSSVLVRASALHNSAEMLELDFKQTASGHSLIGWWWLMQ